MTSHTAIDDICHDADRTLWSAYAAGRAGRAAGRLLFPSVRNGQIGELRVSEQEARFAFVEALISRNFHYAVEVPTEKTYQFTGKFPKSAQSDLAVYEVDAFNAAARICNVEFKAKGISSGAEDHEPIRKDFEKLLRERYAGVWYHVLDSVDNSTICKLVTVMNDQIARVYGCFAQDIHAPLLTVHICVLHHCFSLHIDIRTDVRPQLPLVDLVIQGGKLQATNALNGWSLRRRP